MIELDDRILDGKKPLTAFDEELAKDFIDKECYFSNDAIDFGNVVLNCQKGRLLSIGELTGVFFGTTKNNSYARFNYCLPTEWVKEEKKEPEKKFRPYTKDEFLNKFECGKPIIIRHKDDHINMFIETMSSVRIDNYMDDVYVRLYERVFDLKELFDEFEWQKSNGEWQPFGKECE